MDKKRKAGSSAHAMQVDKSRNDKTSNASSISKKMRKLGPPRPFPTVPTSVSATGPPSAHVDGKNYICITRRSPLGAYLRRCKDLVIKDGHKKLHLHALGAAIPHLARLAISLPQILPFASDEIHIEMYTGTVELKDEVIPDDEDLDITIQTRGKSTMAVIITIGGGKEDTEVESRRVDTGKQKPCIKQDHTAQDSDPGELVFQEEDLGDGEYADNEYRDDDHNDST